MKLTFAITISVATLFGICRECIRYGYRLGRCSVQDANDLLGAGFRIVDDPNHVYRINPNHEATWFDDSAWSTIQTYFETYIIGDCEQASK